MSGAMAAASERNRAKFEVVKAQGTQPFARVKSSSAVTKDGKLFLFGGFDEDDRVDSNVYIMNLETLQWSTRKHHVYREGHSALGIGGDDILIYGGISEDSTTASSDHSDDDLIIYNVSKSCWRTAPVLGAKPPQRSRHAACLSADGTKMFISGGQIHDDIVPLDDLYCYNISTGEWDGPRTFISRFDHSIAFFDNKIWAFGGFTMDMAHATEISYFDLLTNTTGSILMNDLPKLEGDHIYIPTMNESLLLDVVVPMWTFEKVEPCIGLYDLKSLRWQSVLRGSFKPLMGYRWRHTFVNNGELYMIGYPLDSDTNDNSFDYRLSDVVKLGLADLGISESLTDNNSQGGVVADLAKLLFREEFSDFKIIGIEGEERPSLNSKFIERTELDAPFTVNRDTFMKSKPIPVHSIILLARWPHFRRIILSGMSESQTNTMFIPEPVGWLAALLEYLYTDQLVHKDAETMTGLLILANIYDLPRLRSLCIQSIYSQGFRIKNVLKIWSRSRLVGEQVMAHNASRFCFYNWGKIVQTRQFRELCKEDIVALCQEVEHDDIIVNNKSSSMLSHSVHDSLEKKYPLGEFGLSSQGQTPPFLGSSGLENSGEDDQSDGELRFLGDDSPTSRFTTPQGSIYLVNPQLGMNSLGERREADDTDMEDD